LPRTVLDFIIKALRTSSCQESNLPEELTLRAGFARDLSAEDLPLRKSGDTHEGYGCQQADISALNSLALNSLLLLYEEKEKLFSQSLVRTNRGLHQNSSSWRGTIIALLGLQRLADSGDEVPFDLVSIRERVLSHASRLRNAGDLGLLTWFLAVCAPDRLEALLGEVDIRKGLEFYPDVRQGHTSGLAWVLAGLAHARIASPRLLSELTDVAVDTYHRLEENQSETGIFGHAASPRSIQEILCNRYGTFSDQIHAIYALSSFARAFEIEEPLELALNCANAVCAEQGEKGQWWFRYDKKRGGVVNRYPVYSAHQDGLAPMALLALEEATGQGYRKRILRGLEWIATQNELGVDLRDLDQKVIWDSIEPRRWVAKYWETASSYLKVSNDLPAESLKVRYEARPSHFGWLLYAFGTWGLPKASLSFQAATTH
jgi:hypothetical protein